MRTFTFALDSGPLALAWLITIIRPDETMVRLTTAQRDLTISGHTWTAEPGLTITNMESFSDGTVSNAQIEFALHDTGVITETDIAIERFRGAPISLQIVNFLSPAFGTDTFTGFVGQISVNARLSVKMEARGPLVKATALAVEVYSAMDRAELGDARNKIPILPPDIKRSTGYSSVDINNTGSEFIRVRVGSAGNPSDYANVYYEFTSTGSTASSQPAYDPNIGNTTTDGSITLIARNAWLRYAQVGSIIDDFHFSIVNLVEPRAIDDWYSLGQALVRSGNGDGLSIEIRQWTQSGNVIFSALPITDLIAPGDWLELIPGYDKLVTTALNKFDDVINFRGEPFAPGTSSQLPGVGPAGPSTATGLPAPPATVSREFGISSPIFQVPIGTPQNF